MAKGEVKYNDAWEWCVSIASSYLSHNWAEHFFLNEEDAQAYYNDMRTMHAALIVDRDSY